MGAIKQRVVVCSGFSADAITAHALNVTKMAEGFARLGHDVLLICRHNKAHSVSAKDLLARYGIDGISVRLTPFSSGNHWKFALHVMRHILTFRPHFVYSRSYILPWLTSRLGIPTSAESHAFVGNNSKNFLKLMTAGQHPALRSLVTIAPVLSDYYQSLGMPRSKIVELPDAVDYQKFLPPSHLPTSPLKGLDAKADIVYTGHLYDYKGIPTILEAAGLLPQCRFHLVGGYKDDIARHTGTIHKMGLNNIHFYGHVDHIRIPEFLWHADALLLPISARHPSADWTSPMKLGEYMAAGKPIIASDTVALRNWISNEHALFFQPDNAESLANAIRQSLADETGQRDRTNAASQLAQGWSFEKRAQTILQYNAGRNAVENTAGKHLPGTVRNGMTRPETRIGD